MSTNLDLLDEEFLSSPETKNKRSPYLLVLCILSFVGCAGWIATFSIVSFIFHEEQNYSWNSNSNFYDYAIPFSFIGIGCGIVCTGCTVLMLLRFRFAYFIYLFAQVLTPAYMAFYHREMSVRRDEELMMLAFFAASTLLFPILYAFAYKSMQR